VIAPIAINWMFDPEKMPALCGEQQQINKAYA
jgi:hypothetical protein